MSRETFDSWRPQATPLGLRTPDGPDLVVTLEELTIRSRGDHPARVVAGLVLELEAWRRVDAAAWLHLVPEVRGPGAIIATGPVRLVARLDDLAVAAAYRGRQLEAREAAAALTSQDPAWDLARDVGAWFALQVLEERLPGLASGFETTWSFHPELTAGSDVVPAAEG